MKTGKILYLTEEEAAWLKALMQNELSGNETVADCTTRASFWIALGGEVKATSAKAAPPPPATTWRDEPGYDPKDDIPF